MIKPQQPSVQPFRCFNAIGVPVSISNMADAVKNTEQLLSAGGNHYICFLEGNLLLQSKTNSKLKEILTKADIVFPDGVALTTLAKINGETGAERVPGPSYMLQICEYGVAKGWRHFFYGGAKGVGEQLAESLCKKFPGVQIVGTYSPPFRSLTNDEESEIITIIEAVQPHFLWVGLGGPKQEYWMSEHLGLIDVPLMLGVGAAFDFHSATRPWAPAIVRKTGCEWIFRALTGGRRMLWRNLMAVPQLALLIANEYISVRILGKKR